MLAVYFFYFGEHSTIEGFPSVWGNADILRGLLQGLDMAHGNPLLNHWYSGADSYWTVDSAVLALGVLIVGAKVVLLHLLSAMVWTGFIFSGAYIATFDLPKSSKFTAALTVGVILGFPGALLAGLLTAPTNHVATSLFALVAFLGLRDSRFSRGWIVAVVLLTAGTLGDPLIVAYGLLPALFVGSLESIRSRNWRAGWPLITAPFTAIIGAGAIRLLSIQLGTFEVMPGTAPVVSRSGAIENLQQVVPDLVSLLGLGKSSSTVGVPIGLEVFRVFGILLTAIGVLVAIGGLLLGVASGQPREGVQGMPDRAEASLRLRDLLVVGFMGAVSTFVGLSFDSSGIRYLTAAVIFGAILGAMFAGQFIETLRTRRAKVIIGSVGMVVAMGVFASSALTMAQPIPTSPYANIGDFLKNHQLTRGVGDYWSSAPITAYTNESVNVRQVVPSTDGGLTPYLWISKRDWYTGTFQFLIFDTSRPSGQSLLHAAKFPFGAVQRNFRQGAFQIIVWKHPLSMVNLLPQ